MVALPTLVGRGRSSAISFHGVTLSKRQTLSLGPASAFLSTVLSHFWIKSKDIQKYAKDYLAPLVASLPPATLTVQSLLYSTIGLGPDKVNVGMMSGAVATATGFVSTQGAAALRVATSQVAALSAGDIALLNGVIQEARAASKGTCKP